MKIYVAGHNGFVGKSIVKKLKDLNYDVITSHRELDLRNQENVNSFFHSYKPDWVFDCAAVVDRKYTFC